MHHRRSRPSARVGGLDGPGGRRAVVDAVRRPAVLVVAENGMAGGVGRYCVDVAAELGAMAELACLCPQPCEATDCWLSARCAERGVTLHRVTVPSRAWRRG